MIAHQRRINPATNNTKPAIANIRPCGSAAAGKFSATKKPAVMLTAITSQIIPSVLRSCFVPVSLRDRRVKLRKISEARKINPSWSERAITWAFLFFGVNGMVTTNRHE